MVGNEQSFNRPRFVNKEIQKDGYVELVPIKGKRREMSIVLTESGKKFADNVLSDLYKKEAEVFKSLSSEEQEIVKALEEYYEPHFLSGVMAQNTPAARTTEQVWIKNGKYAK